MLRIQGIVGHVGDSDFQSLLHLLEHAGCIEVLFIPSTDVGRKRFRLKTDRGTDCAISLDRNEMLADGAVLYIDAERAIVARFGEEQVWRLLARDQAAALKLGWNAGNLHWRVRFEGHVLEIQLDRPLQEYRARILQLIESGEVREVANV
ncbi:Urease accessory protein UreE 1 [Mesorhizobium plurifarium]|uniref:Urease accessory protein UreE 1 n=1 Tax=Mesorhizobium plurifarium TaxID=69974 RepID=A0A090E5R6_MESPL|nr:Urease accessory protein UreE 1 [Mesorhizobium plurifarium]